MSPEILARLYVSGPFCSLFSSSVKVLQQIATGLGWKVVLMRKWEKDDGMRCSVCNIGISITNTFPQLPG